MKMRVLLGLICLVILVSCQSPEEYFYLKSPLKFDEKTLVGNVSKPELREALETYHVLPDFPLVLVHKEDKSKSVSACSCKASEKYFSQGCYPDTTVDINLATRYRKFCDVCDVLLKASPLKIKSGEFPFPFSENIKNLTIGALPTTFSFDRLLPLGRNPLMTVEDLEKENSLKIRVQTPYQIRLTFEGGKYLIFTEFTTAHFQENFPTILVSVSSGSRGTLTYTGLCYFYQDPKTGLIFRYNPEAHKADE